MSGVVALHLTDRLALLADDRQVPITNLFDADGDETADPAEAVAVVCGEGMEWYSVNLAEFDKARVQ